MKKSRESGIDTVVDGVTFKNNQVIPPTLIPSFTNMPTKGVELPKRMNILIADAEHAEKNGWPLFNEEEKERT